MQRGAHPAILTYHSHNVGGEFSPHDDHAALAGDLQALHAAGLKVVPLSSVLDWLDGETGEAETERLVCLTFDDGCDLDFRDLDFPGAGPRRSFLGIMQDFIALQGPRAQPDLHATSFVIASGGARQEIDARSLFGRGWISDDWWRDAISTSLISIGNHSWDHNHPDLAPHDEGRGDFTAVASEDQCRQQVEVAARLIADKTGRWPDLFAYPFGQSSEYMRREYFPQHRERHGCRAACGADPGPVTRDSDPWNLPRYVCGRDWRSPGELLRLLG